MFGKPTDVTGKGTIEKLLKDERFTKCDDYNALKLTDGPQYWAASRQTIAFGKLCPKCGKEFPRGLPMHVKYCKA